jgi:hypothetical protein
VSYCCPKDKHITELDLDFSSMRRIRKSFNPEAIQWMASDELRSKEDLEVYRNKIHLSAKIEHDGDVLTLEEPSIRRWLEVNLINVDTIVEAIDGTPSMFKRSVWNKVQLHLHHGVLPWISKITMKSIDGKTLFFEGDIASRGYLDDRVDDESFGDLMNLIVGEIGNFEQTIICHVPPVCEVCQYTDKDVEYYLWDPSMAFLVTTYQKLAMSGLQMTSDSETRD